MSHPDSPEYFTLISIDEYDGSPTVLGIYEDLDAIMYRLKQCYVHCGNEFRIECFHLGTKEAQRKQYNEQLVNREKYRKEEAEKKAKLKEYELLKNGGDDNEV